MIDINDRGQHARWMHAGVEVDWSQSTDLQRDALLIAGVESDNFYEDQASGKKDDRPHLEACLKMLRKGTLSWSGSSNEWIGGTTHSHSHSYAPQLDGVRSYSTQR